jgi:glutamate carboxypeptidase
MKEIVNWLEHQHSKTVEHLTHWCDTNSWSLDAKSLRRMADVLYEDFRHIGVDFMPIKLPPVRTLGEDGQWAETPTGPGLLWHLRPSATRRVLLMIHYDTVYPVESQPSKCRVDGCQLIGPGSADAKGGIATIFSALASILNFNLAENIGISVFLNPDEEIGSPASKVVMQELAPQFDMALLFEPRLPDGSLVRARKGSGNFSFIVHGRAAHAGRDPGAGRNAIVQAARLTLALSALHSPDSGVQINVGRVNGGGPLNQVPAKVVVQLNVRVDTVEILNRIQEQLRRLVDEYSTDGYRIEVQGEFHAPPKVANARLAALQAMIERASQRLGRAVNWRDTGGACDGSKLANLGLPNIDTLGVCGDGLHSGGEYCDLGSLVPAASLTVATILEFADRP